MTGTDRKNDTMRPNLLTMQVIIPYPVLHPVMIIMMMMMMMMMMIMIKRMEV